MHACMCMYQRFDIQYLYDGPDVQKGAIMCKDVEPFLLKSAYELNKLCMRKVAEEMRFRGNLYTVFSQKSKCVTSVTSGPSYGHVPGRWGLQRKPPRPTRVSWPINFSL